MPRRPEESSEIESLVIEYLERAEAGAGDPLPELCERHPGLASELRRRVEALRHFGAAVGEVDPAIPEQLGEYQLIERLGEGGMGVVYLAEQVSLQRRVALKLVRPEQLHFRGTLDRFQREVEAVAALAHPGIASIHSVGCERGLPYFVMELVRGASLASVLRRLSGCDPAGLTGADFGRQLAAQNGIEPEASNVFSGTWPQACARIVRQVAEALEHAHRRGVVHRDIKPSNIMLSPEGRALLIDFGLASQAGSTRLTRTGSVLGSLAYMPPELLAGPAQGADARNDLAGPRADIYSLGVTLFELLALCTPFDASSEATLRRAVDQGECRPLRQRNAAVPGDLAAVCAVAMESDPGRRYPTAGALARDLTNWLEGRPIEARPPSFLVRSARWAGRNPAATVAAALGGILLIGGPVAYGLVQARALEKISAKNDELAAAKLEVEQTNDELLGALDRTETEQRRAERNLDHAIGAVGSFLRIVGEERLDDRPWMQPVRAELLDEAAAFYRVLLGEQPDRAELRRGLTQAVVARASVSLLLGELAEAEADLRAQRETSAVAFGRTPDPWTTWGLVAVEFELAKVLTESGRHREAADLLAGTRALLANSPKDGSQADELASWVVSLAVNHGLALKLLGDYDAAAEAADTAMSAVLARVRDSGEPLGAALATQYAAVLGLRSELAFYTGEPRRSADLRREAVDMLRTAASAAAEGRALRAELLVQLELLSDRLSALSDPTAARAAAREAYALASGLVDDFPSAVTYLGAKGRTASALAGVEAQLGEVETSRALIESAVEAFETLIRLAPDNVERSRDLSGALVNLSIHHQWEQDYEGALALLERAIDLQARALELNPEDQHLRFLFAGALANQGSVLLTSQGDLDGAEHSFGRAAAESDDFRLLRFLAGEHLRLADAAESPAVATHFEDLAMELMRRAVDQGFDNPVDLRDNPQLERLRARAEFRELSRLE